MSELSLAATELLAAAAHVTDAVNVAAAELNQQYSHDISGLITGALEQAATRLANAGSQPHGTFSTDLHVAREQQGAVSRAYHAYLGALRDSVASLPALADALTQQAHNYGGTT